MIRRFALAVLLFCFVAALAAPWLAPGGPEKQYRDEPSALPSKTHILGTDDLGRDSFARLLYGMRVSLLLAPAAAGITVLLGALIGTTAGMLSGWKSVAFAGVIDLVLCMPWLFLLLTVRSMLPLNVSPLFSVTLTFLLLGALGWPATARVVRSSVSTLRASEFVLQARAAGLGGRQLMQRHLFPNLIPVLAAQFVIALPLFILAEANLGMLGLGVTEPMPSWGNLLRGMQSFASFQPHLWEFAPLISLVAVVSCFQFLVSSEASSEAQSEASSEAKSH